ncbi:MAG TPA: hypothetical protein VMW80_13420 [Candidatus Dormibacteraeota bacterium]|nr:hypothetical protein [Candidatus Dormibacteraeota bacterium]
MATRAGINQVVTSATKPRSRRAVARAKVSGDSLAPSYEPMWSLADQSIEIVDKGLRILPGGLGRPQARRR